MQIPAPDTRVVELRVHGILGATGDALTDSVASVDVAGDGVGRIVRPADRLRRPVPGPMLSAGERTVPRIVEGYVWGGMTSGGWAKATWALLFPFALANVAHWMLPPTRTDHAGSRILSGVLRGLLRLSALLLTMLFVAQLAVAGLDLLAAQCLSPGSGCLSFVPEKAREFEILRAAVALLPVALVILLMRWLSTVSWPVSTSGQGPASGQVPGDSQPARAPDFPGTNVVSDPDTPSLRALHITAALSTVVILALGGPFSTDGDPRGLIAMALAAFAMLAVCLLDDPTGSRTRTSGKLTQAGLGRTARRTLLSLGGVLLASIAVAPPALNGPLPGSGSTIDLITALLLAIGAAVAVLLVPATLLARPRWAHLAPRLRPWAGGWMAAPMLLISYLLGSGFGAGLALSMRQALGTTGLHLPAAYNDITLFWGTTTMLLIVAALLALPWILVVRWRKSRADDTVSSEVALLHAGRQQDQRNAAGAWDWADLQRRYAHRALLVLAAVLTVSAGLTFAIRTLTWTFEGSGWLVALGVGALAALAGGLLRMVYLAAKEPDAARYLGLLADLTLFWPRAAHPVVPPCYALKVVPELAARASEHLEDPNTRVVLVGHSQGSLLAAVAAARLLDSLPEADRERVGLVTAGSQLQWAYPRAFPGVLPHDSLRDLAGTLSGRWRSLCRGTDALGGAVGTWNRQVYDGMLIGVGFRADGTEGPLPAAARGPTGALVLGGDHWLPDPQRGPFSFRRWVPGVLGHSDYSGDPEWDRAVAMASGLEIPVRGATLPLRTRTTTPVPPTPKPTESTHLHAHGDDGSTISDSVEEWSAEQPDVDTEDRRPPEADQSRGPDADSRPEPSELPEITEPRGRTAPWERGVSLRASDR